MSNSFEADYIHIFLKMPKNFHGKKPLDYILNSFKENLVFNYLLSESFYYH